MFSWKSHRLSEIESFHSNRFGFSLKLRSKLNCLFVLVCKHLFCEFLQIQVLRECECVWVREYGCVQNRFHCWCHALFHIAISFWRISSKRLVDFNTCLKIHLYEERSKRELRRSASVNLFALEIESKVGKFVVWNVWVELVYSVRNVTRWTRFR